jgi:thiol-disulfide isomerase/thioredoxin
MMFRTLNLALLLTTAASITSAALVQDVRDLLAKDDFAAAERLIAQQEKQSGRSPETILAQSWLGRRALATKQWAKATAYAAQTRQLALAALKTRKIDAEPQLPTALGASIEVHGQALAGAGQRTEAVSYLEGEFVRWRPSSMAARIRKNVNLISLVGKPAPPLEMREFIGNKPPTIAALKGKPVVLFFWAHWCPDCKRQGPILARLEKEFAAKGLVVVGPTQRYGYVAEGEDAPPAIEQPYIAKVQKQFYGDLNMSVPLSEDNFKNWGCSTTPTLALIDRAGIVRLYHPGDMSYEDLRAEVVKIAN